MNISQTPNSASSWVLLAITCLTLLTGCSGDKDSDEESSAIIDNPPITTTVDSDDDGVADDKDISPNDPACAQGYEGDSQGCYVTSLGGREVELLAESNGVFYLKVGDKAEILAFDAINQSFNPTIAVPTESGDYRLIVNNESQIALMIQTQISGTFKTKFTSIDLETGTVLANMESIDVYYLDVFLNDSFIALASINGVEIYGHSLAKLSQVSIDLFDEEDISDIESFLASWDRSERSLKYYIYNYDDDVWASLTLKVSEDLTSLERSSNIGATPPFSDSRKQGNYEHSYFVAEGLAIDNINGQIINTKTGTLLHNIDSMLDYVSQSSFHPDSGLITLNTSINSTKNAKNIFGAKISADTAMSANIDSSNRIYFGSIIGVSAAESGLWAIELNDNGLVAIDLNSNLLKDDDSDGIPNWWESFYGLSNEDSADAANDTDSDGLTHLQEYLFNSNPNSNDSDQDGLMDLDEHDLYFSKPYLIDSDLDRLTDKNEATIHNTNLINADTDEDSYSDYDEINVFDSSPIDATSTPQFETAVTETFDSPELSSGWPTYDPDDGVYMSQDWDDECSNWLHSSQETDQGVNGIITSDSLSNGRCSAIEYNKSMTPGEITFDVEVISLNEGRLYVYLDNNLVRTVEATEWTNIKIALTSDIYKLRLEAQSDNNDNGPVTVSIDNFVYSELVKAE